MVKKLWKSATYVVEILLLLQLHHRVWLLTFEMLKPVVIRIFERLPWFLTLNGWFAIGDYNSHNAFDNAGKTDM